MSLVHFISGYMEYVFKFFNQNLMAMNILNTLNVQSRLNRAVSLTALCLFLCLSANLVYSQDKPHSVGDNSSKDWTIVASYTIPGKASGLAFDGTYIYFGIYGSNGDKFYRFDPSNGTNTLLFSVPSVNDCYGMTYDGNHLWITDHGTSSSVPAYALELDFSGNIISQFNLPDHYMSGIAYDDGNFWAATYYPNPGKIYKVNSSGTILKQIPSPNEQPWDLCLAGSDLWVADYNLNKLYKIDQDGLILEEHLCESQKPAGIVFDGTYLWYVDGALAANSTLYKVDPGGAGTPEIYIPLTSYNYGIVATGDSAVWNCQISNTGTADLVIENAIIQNAVPIFHWQVFPQTVAPGNSFNFPLIFRPTEPGSLNTTVTIESNDPINPLVNLTLTGEAVTPGPQISLSSLFHSYGPVRKNATTRWFVTITNTGDEPLQVTQISTDNPRFFADGSISIPFQLNPLQTKEVGIWFNPVEAVNYSGEISIFSNDPVTNPAKIMLEGSGNPATYPIGSNLWNHTITGGTDNSPKAIGPIPDVSGDGVNDVIICSEDGNIRCFNGNASLTADILWVNNSGSVQGQNDFTVIDDVDNDGYRDIAVGLVGGVRAIKAISGKTGVTIWTYDTHTYGGGGWVYQVWSGFDYNNDGVNDVLASTGNDANNTGPKRIFCLNGITGVPVWECYTNGPNFSVIGVDDFTGDGLPDVIGGGSNLNETQGKVFGINGTNGSISWTFTTIGTSVWALEQLDDINGNNIHDIIAGDFGGRYYLLEASTGAQLYTATIGSYLILRFEKMGDLNGDGHPDICIGHSGSNAVAVNGYNGQNIWLHPVADKPWNLDRIADINGDGINDLVTGTLYSSNYAYFLDGTTGNELFSVNFSEPVDAIGAIPDIASDGSMEMIAGGRYGKVVCYSGGLNSSIPGADFIADHTAIVPGQTVTFTDLSIHNPVEWFWVFEGGSPGTSTLQNPQVIYNTPGVYDVKLRISNASGIDSVLKTDYIYVESLPVSMSLKSFMQGPFDVTSMKTDLSQAGYIPLSQPYNEYPWNYDGTEYTATVPVNAVDWVLVELRETAGDVTSANASTMIARQACFLLEDGSIKSTDGISDPLFIVNISENLYVVIWHRNHLGIISSVALVNSGNSYTYDFSTGPDKAYGGTLALKSLGNGIWGMYCGDADGNGSIQNQDKLLVWKPEVGTSGYRDGDMNLNGTVDNQDKINFWKINAGRNSQVP